MWYPLRQGLLRRLQTSMGMFEQTNHWGTAELVYALEENPVKQLIFVSSTAVYGSTEEPATKRPNQGRIVLFHFQIQAEQHLERLYKKVQHDHYPFR